VVVVRTTVARRERLFPSPSCVEGDAVSGHVWEQERSPLGHVPSLLHSPGILPAVRRYTDPCCVLSASTQPWPVSFRPRSLSGPAECRLATAPVPFWRPSQKTISLAERLDVTRSWPGR
jgi:hypothetical protein